MIEPSLRNRRNWKEQVARRRGLNSYGDNDDDDNNTKMLHAVDTINVDTLKACRKSTADSETPTKRSDDPPRSSMRVVRVFGQFPWLCRLFLFFPFYLTSTQSRRYNRLIARCKNLTVKYKNNNRGNTLVLARSRRIGLAAARRRILHEKKK